MNPTRRALFAMAVMSPVLVCLDSAQAQSKRQPVVIGWLSLNSRSPAEERQLAAFRQGLAALGWKEGVQFKIEGRWADGRPERLPALAVELAASKVAVIVGTPGSRAVVAAAKAAPDIPIVQASGGDLVDAGLAKSFARPGGMVTGITYTPVEASEKAIEFLLIIAPKLRRIGFLIDPNVLSPALQAKVVQRAAERHSFEPRIVNVAKIDEIEPALLSLAKQGVEGLVPMPSPLLSYGRKDILRFAEARRWPVAASMPSWVEGGTLVNYGYDTSQNYHRAAYFVDRILKGTKPGDIPIEQPLKFELVLNAKTAKALGLKIPQELLLRADRVIE